MLIKIEEHNQEIQIKLDEFLIEHGIESESIEDFLDQFETIENLAKQKIYGTSSNLRQKISRGTIKAYKNNMLLISEVPKTKN